MFFSGLLSVAIIVVGSSLLLESDAALLNRSEGSFVTPSPGDSLPLPTQPPSLPSLSDTTTTPTIVVVDSRTAAASQKQQVKQEEHRPTRPPRRQSSARVNGPGCSEVTCKADEVCVSKSKYRQQATSCISKNLAQLVASRNNRDDKTTQNRLEEINYAQMTRDSLKLDEKIQRIKAQVEEFEVERVRSLQKRLEMITLAMSPPSPAAAASTDEMEFDDSDAMQNDASPETVPLDCYSKGLEIIGERLLDKFKQDQDAEQSRKEKHKKEKRNSTKKDLHEDDECICQPPVNWKFQKLDTDFDGRLGSREIDSLHGMGNLSSLSSPLDTHCLATFVKACDHDNDAMLSEKEWCCCFSDVLPPCFSAMRRVPSILISGRASVVPGAFIPQCDGDGFYQPAQCDSNDGRCWCTDRNGNKIKDLSPDGNSNC